MARTVDCLAGVADSLLERLAATSACLDTLWIARDTKR